MRRIFWVSIACLAPVCGCDSAGSRQGYEPEQPIRYSHALHAGELQMDCQYCHFGAETSRHAGVPPTQVCMNCHNQVRKDSPEVAKIKASMDQNKPIEWVKVHRLPDFVRFDHSRHVTRGVKCQTCHGAVEKMPRVRQEASMSMGWCLTCHRDPAASLGPAAEGVRPPSDCAACHQ